ncbi:MAG: hydrolase, family [Candidatus Saccharibacteria bacterium]|nr:hydrolase, family [Candidatus Saccharibacteria bacterium]
MAYGTILFDIDGTLCDPGDSIIESARFALAKLGIEETDEQALRRFVGPPLEYAFKDYYDFDEDTTKKAVTLFREKLQSDGIKLYKAYDGVTELLDELLRAGKTVAVVTSKINHIARAALESTGIAKYFEVVGSQQPDEVVKKEVVLSRVLSELGVTDKSSVVMIGDRMHDIEAAKEYGIDSIGVLWGYGSLEELQEEGATHIVKDTHELQRLLA